MIRFIPNFITALRSYITAAKLIFQSTMWIYFAIPALLSFGLYWGGEMLTDSIKGLDLSKFESKDGQAFLLLGIQSIAVYITVHMNKYLVLALLAPLLAGLSTKTEKMLTGNKYPFVIKYYLEDIRRALIISFRNMGYQMLVMAIFFAVTFIYSLPSIVNQIVYFVVAFYFYGFAFMDYASERRRLTVAESVKFTRKHAGAAFGLGAIYGSVFFIPYAGVIIAPIFGVVAGTATVHALVDLSKNEYAQRPGDEPQQTEAATAEEVEVEEEKEEKKKEKPEDSAAAADAEVI